MIIMPLAIGSLFNSLGEGKVNFVDVRDIAAVAVQSLVSNKDGIHSGKAYTITGPEAISYRDAARILSDYIGRKVSYVSISEDGARKAIKEMGMSDWHTNILLELLRLSREGYLSSISNAVEEVTGKKTNILFPIRQRLYISFQIGIGYDAR